MPAMDPVVARYAARGVPRYTSYPSAPHFKADFPEGRYRGWLAALDPATPVSLYLHVPFCRQMCWYCGCNMKLARRYEPIAAYVDVLLEELALVSEALPARMTLSHLHWGGGTPTALEPRDLARVMAAVRHRFDLAEDAELAIESDPRTLTREMTHVIGALGFTRASFGVQEFNAQVQQAINRVQPPAMVESAVDALRSAGVGAINFDLIYGLPFQTAPSLAATVSAAAAMSPDRLALFGYAHVPWMAKNQRMIPEEALPGPAARAEQASLAADTLETCGFTPIGIDHFARPTDDLARAAREGRLHRNFQGYTTDSAETLIGLGATAIGATPFGHVQNLSETRAWARAVEAGRLPVAKGLVFSGEDRLRAHVIERIMCDGRADVAEAARRFGARPDWATESLSALGELVADGLVLIEGPQVALTPRGRPLARIAAAAFDAYLHQGGARHSQAV